MKTKMDIVKYIIEILKDNDKLIIPGLGSFTVEHKPAQIHPVEHTFAPPVKNLVFESITSDDDALALKISEQENISIDKACKIIKNFSDGIVSSVQKDKIASIDGLGVFSLTADNLIAFAPDSAVFSDEEFGLTGFTSPAIVRTEFKDKAALNAQKAKDEKIKRSKSKRRYLTVAASVVIVTALIFIVFFTDILRNYLYKNEVEPKIEKAIVATETPAPVQVATNDITNSESEIQSTPAEKTPITETKEVSPDVSVTENTQAANQYYLVAGSFKVEENANKKVLELKNKGYKNAGIIRQSNNGMYIVYYESYAVKADATKALQQVTKAENSDSWLLKK